MENLKFNEKLNEYIPRLRVKCFLHMLVLIVLDFFEGDWEVLFGRYMPETQVLHIKRFDCRV